MSSIRLGPGLEEELTARALEAGAHEACGLLLGPADAPEDLQRFVPARNIASDPVRGFEVDPGDLVAAEDQARSLGLAIAAIWHSHPSTPAIPSEEDRRDAYAGWLYLISGPRELRCWRLRGPRFVEERIL